MVSRSTNLNLSLNKSLKPVLSSQKREVEYLQKIAEFRFGITTMGKFKVNSSATRQPFGY